MTRSGFVPGALVLGILCCSVAFGQAQELPQFSRDYCVKVRDGKGSEYAAFLRDVVAKLAQVRVDSGAISSFTIAQAVVPLGREARCDYHIVTGYSGFPTEGPGAEQTEADMKKAGISMTREEMWAKRNELSYLVGMDIWRWRERVGPTLKGGFARLNYDKIQPGMGAEWLDQESNGWKQLAEVAAKEHGTAWRAATLAMPSGSDQPYNALTVDIYPSWEALGKGIPTREIWNRVHPDSDMSAYLNRLSTIRERPRVYVVRLIEVIQ